MDTAMAPALRVREPTLDQRSTLAWLPALLDDGPGVANEVLN